MSNVECGPVAGVSNPSIDIPIDRWGVKGAGQGYHYVVRAGGTHATRCCIWPKVDFLHGHWQITAPNCGTHLVLGQIPCVHWEKIIIGSSTLHNKSLR